MEEQKRKAKEQELILRMIRTLLRKSNDAVKLAYLDGDHLEDEIDRLDLSLLSELKRNANGSVEIKLVDRVKALSQLLPLLEQPDGLESEHQSERLYRALEQQAGGQSHGD